MSEKIPGSWLLNAENSLDRRVFLKGVGYISLGVVASTLFGGCESILEQIQNRPIRRRLGTGTSEVDQDVEIYKDAVSQMKMLDSSDPRSWDAQASIHGTVTGGFNHCRHGSPHFFSWHRAYLLYFERICQELTGENDFGLPYWNWNQDPSIHPAFLESGGPLNHSRNNTTVAGNPAFTDMTLDPIFGDSNFFTFSSQLEGTPHNTAHVVVGQDMRTGGSPQDPVFWAHHCMVDYCWAKWNIELDNDNPADSEWNGTSWNHFFDQDGGSATTSASATTLMPLLSYQYEASAIGGFGTEMALMARSTEDLEKLEERLRRGADIRSEIIMRVPIVKGVKVPIDRTVSYEAKISNESFASLLEVRPEKEQVFINVDYAELPEASDFFVRVFIDRPDADMRTPTEDPHYAGSFAFFGSRREGMASRHGKTGYLVNVTETLKRLGRTEGAISVQLVAVPALKQFTRPRQQLTLEGIDLIVSRVTIKQK